VGVGCSWGKAFNAPPSSFTFVEIAQQNTNSDYIPANVTPFGSAVACTTVFANTHTAFYVRVLVAP
jgi:hypothetical protein